MRRVYTIVLIGCCGYSGVYAQEHSDSLVKNLPDITIVGRNNKSDKTFSDANNTVQPSIHGQTGLIPAYTIVDCSMQINCSSSIVLKAGLNNVFNVHYFTRRAGGYPGPGLLPGDGRNYFVTLSATL